MSGADHVDICGYGLRAIEEIRDPTITFVQLNQVRAQLSCPGCIQAFNMELKVKTALVTATRETPPITLQTRISAALGRIDLAGVDVSDL